LGTAGEEIDNVEQFVEISDKLELMAHTLNFRHLAPTAPDTLSAYPFDNCE
jgi:DNA polymerase delta subunit 2